MDRVRTDQVLHWLLRSIAIHGGNGSAAFAHLWKPWAPPYPETTGYIIETLFDYGKDEAAFSCADWLCTLQKSDGSFPGGVGMQGPPVVFDSAMILTGLIAAYRNSENQNYFKAIEAAVNWLLGQLSAEGTWQTNTYFPGYSTAYHSRIVWMVLEAGRILPSSALQTNMKKALDHSLSLALPNHAVRDWGFAPGQAAFTHTIAYTLRGWLEAGTLLQAPRAIEQAAGTARKLLEIRTINGKLGGSYDDRWQGDDRFICVTGHAQLSIVLARLFQMTGDPDFLRGARLLFADIAKSPCLLPTRQLHGAVPGSLPWWGGYQPWRFPNWAAKFYLDAAKLLTDLSIAE